MPRHTVSSCLVAVALLALLAGVVQPSEAQTTTQVVVGDSNADRSAPVIALGLASQHGPFEFGIEGGRLFDIVPAGVGNASRLLSGGAASARLPAWYGMALGRVLVPIGPLQPFVAGGTGGARLAPSVHSFNSAASLPVIFGGDESARVRFMTTMGAGVRIGTGPLRIEGGYRWLRVFQHYRPDTNFSNDDVLVSARVVYGALVIRF